MGKVSRALVKKVPFDLSEDFDLLANWKSAADLDLI